MNQVMRLISLPVLFVVATTAPAQPPKTKLPPGIILHRDLEYVKDGHERHRLDIYLPEKPHQADGPLPVIVWVHGGAWQAGSKESMWPALPFVTKGYAVAAINYRLSQHALFPAQIEDCKAAIRWLRANAQKYRLDPERIAAWGSSAGGHLVALLGTAGDVKELEGTGGNLDQSSRVQAVVNWYGPTDFTKMGGWHDGPTSPEAKLIGGPVQQHKDKAARANPIIYVTEDDPPFLIMHGDKDPTVPFNQSELLHAALKKAGVEVIFHPVKGAGHGGKEFGSPESRRLIEEFLDKHLRKKNSARTPRQVAEELAAVYGHKLDQVAYITALPLVAKLRLSELTGDRKHADQVNEIVGPFRRGEKSPVPKSGSEQAGHLIFAELAKRADGKDRERLVALCKSAADQIFAKDGKPLPIMPFHNEMSDAVFMAGPILAATGKLTGERKYFDAAATHFASMRKLCLRSDGIYRHSPLCEAAWGRGNGFPALGLALALSDWPDDHPAKKELLAEFQQHMAALKPHQDAKTGCWHQVIDHPESYDEYSCTCMIGFAMQRGIGRGWLAKDEYGPSVERAWRAIAERTSPDGKLVNVCAGTGKQKTLQAYFDRPAINGRDDRGGAMGMMFATELLAGKDGAIRRPLQDRAGLTTWLKDTKRADPRGIFSITDGLLHISGDGFGYVATDKEYRDYHLTVEYKWGKRTDGRKYVRNSGILLHATGADGGAGGTWMASIECQLAQGCVGDLIVIRGKDEQGEIIPVSITSDVALGPDKRPRWQAGGEKRIFTKGQLWWNRHDPTFKELLDTRGKDDVESPLGEWTRVECICRGKEITVKVNGVTVNHCYDVFPAAGKILLQTEGFEIYFRKFELRPLE